MGTSVASKLYEIRAHLRNEIRLERKKIKEREEMERKDNALLASAMARERCKLNVGVTHHP